MRIGVVEVFVADQDRAGAFYAGLFGFQVKNDASYGDTAHWLTVVSPEDPDGPELLLAPMSETAAALQAARPRDGRTRGVVHHPGLPRNCRVLAGRGGRVRVGAQPMRYGGTDAVVEDGCGKLLNLHQD